MYNFFFSLLLQTKKSTCLICDRVFEQRSYLNQHYRSHKIELYAPEYCPSSLHAYITRYLSEEMDDQCSKRDDQHTGEPSEQTAEQSNIELKEACEAGVKSEKPPRDNMLVFNYDNVGFCKICKRYYKTADSLRNHLFRCHQGDLSGWSVKRY